MDDTNPGPHRKPSIATMIVWVLFCFVMWGWAIIGTLWLIAGAIYYFTDFEVIDIQGATRDAKLASIGPATAICPIGLAFVWLRCRGYLKFGDRQP